MRKRRNEEQKAAMGSRRLEEQFRRNGGLLSKHNAPNILFSVEQAAIGIGTVVGVGVAIGVALAVTINVATVVNVAVIFIVAVAIGVAISKRNHCKATVV
ncbi:hypothetical protein PoB_006145200 [Plakobranchus ocellatus]|uniref:Uncharacterized protein n=1 Tax=Plakobranchus ocellatus TaxID=259542 RepID=A0AAV4CSR9_9GAST|nr:hypothetical protein PoB_006145200 [Plakobranchus ocellatus]